MHKSIFIFYEKRFVFKLSVTYHVVQNIIFDPLFSMKEKDYFTWVLLCVRAIFISFLAKGPVPASLDMSTSAKQSAAPCCFVHHSLHFKRMYLFKLKF